ncbi:MAG TPA: MATE family efflux transporter, partial [Planctomycetota bacterium]|nr:MATE family efflux transporter [Planctomycetota bacterium]
VALGGVGLGNSSFFTITLLGLGTIMALDPLVAQAFGANERPRCGRLLWQGVWLAIALSVPLTLLFVDFGWVLRLCGEPPAIVEAASAYLRGRALNVPTVLLFGALRAFLNGVGNTRAVMVVALLANVVNAGVVYALVHGAFGLPALGVFGAGLGSSIAGLFMAAATAYLIAGGRYRDFGTDLQGPRLADLRHLVRFGAPIAGQIVAEVGVFNATFFVIGRLGEVPLAAHQIALQLASTTFMVPLGVGVAGSIRVGHAIGRGSREEALRAGYVAYLLGVGFMALSAGFFALFPGPLVDIFQRDPKPEVATLAVALIRIAALFQLSDGAQAVGAGCLRGAGDSRTAFFVNLVAHWGLGFPLGYWLGIRCGLGAAGLWYGLTASLTAVAALLAARFASGKWSAT